MTVFRQIKRSLQNLFHIEEIIDKRIKNALLIERFEKLSWTTNESGISKQLDLGKPLIVSLTTYGKRIFDVYLSIESIMQQTVQANSIILWLSEKEFSDESLPHSLKMLMDRGLTIKYCEDTKSYKKLIPTVSAYPDSIIITVDDDVLYGKDLIENFVKSYLEDSNCIYFNRGHKIRLDNKGKILPYLDWEWEIKNSERSLLNFPTGVGGVLYPPHCFGADLLDSEKFLDLAPTSDDIWFKAMTLINNLPCAKSYGSTKIHDMASAELGLNQINNGLVNNNDKWLRKVFEKYRLDEILNHNK